MAKGKRLAKSSETVTYVVHFTIELTWNEINEQQRLLCPVIKTVVYSTTRVGLRMEPSSAYGDHSLSTGHKATSRGTVAVLSHTASFVASLMKPSGTILLTRDAVSSRMYCRGAPV